MSNDNTRIISRREYTDHRYILYFENNEKLSVDEETYLKNSWYELEELTEEQYDKILFDSQSYEAYRKAVNYLTYGKKTKNRIVTYLVQKGYDYKISRHAAELLESQGKIDDDQFISVFISKNMKNGITRDKLIAKLIYHGISMEKAIKEVDKVIKTNEDTY
jgi:regulatory protein